MNFYLEFVPVTLESTVPNLVLLRNDPSGKFNCNLKTSYRHEPVYESPTRTASIFRLMVVRPPDPGEPYYEFLLFLNEIF